jgi:hypothetical protein
VYEVDQETSDLGGVAGRLTGRPEEAALPPRSSKSRLVRAGALLLGVLLIGTAFIASYVGALHEPQPRDIPVGVVSADTNARALLGQLGQRSNRLRTTVFATAQDADRALADRRVYAVLATDPASHGLRLTVSSGAAPGIADLVTQTVGAATSAAHLPLAVRDAHPTSASDPRGLTPFYLVVGWLLGGYLAATALAVVLGTVPRGPVPLGARLAAFAAFAVLSGLAGALLTGPGYGIWPAHLAALWLTGSLVVFAAAAVTAALESWIGLLGTGIAMLLFFVLGNPGSGGVYPPELMPAFFRGMHDWLPTGMAVELVRAVEYFGGAGTAWPLVGLVLWTVGGLAVLQGAMLAYRGRHPTPAPQPAAG